MSKNKTVRNVFFLVFCLFACVSLGYAESCSSKGQIQYKYTASGCGYTTQSRTCCSNGSWSAWDKACPVAECKNGETKECGSGKCGQKTCVNERWSACETIPNRLGSTAYNHDTYCTTGGHNVWCGASEWLETLKCCGFSQSIGLVGNRDDIDYSKCGNTYWGYACCRKAELLYPNTNEGRQDWSDTGAVEYVK